MILEVLGLWVILVFAVSALLLRARIQSVREAVVKRLKGFETSLEEPGRNGVGSGLEAIRSRIGEKHATRTLCFLAPAALILTLSRSWWSLLVTLPCALFLPGFLERLSESRRRKLVRAQLQDFLDAMIQSLEGGFSLYQALEFSADDVAPPLSLELKRAVAEIHYGGELEDILVRLGESIGEPEFDTIMETLLLLKQSGGNLPLLLRKLRVMMRDRAEAAREIRVYTTQGRWSGYVVAALPVAFLAIESVFSPSLIRPLFATPVGLILLTTGIAMDAAGFFCVRHISRLGRTA
jgi:tight adherence protein B